MTDSGPPTTARRWVYVAAVVLVIVHQDFWLWHDSRVVLGFLPVGLAYHAAYSLAAALWCVMAIKLAWPADREAWADQSDDP